MKARDLMLPDASAAAVTDDIITFEVLHSGTSPQLLSEIVEFYNAHFTSPHSVAGVARRYNDASTLPINIVARRGRTMIGLLESNRRVIADRPVRLLATILVHPGHRGNNLSKTLFERMLSRISETAVVLHFRDSSKAALEPIYMRLGFDRAQPAGVYPRSHEARWQMVRVAR